MKKLTLILLVLIGFTSCTSRNNNNNIKELSISNSLNVVYDIPSLKGKNIDQVIEILGVPENDNSEPTELQKRVGINEWNKSYKREGYELLITYEVKSRRIIDYFIPTNDPSGITKDYNDLLRISNSQNNSNVIVEPVNASIDPSSYTGVKIMFKK